MSNQLPSGSVKKLVKTICKANGWERQELARALGVAPETVSRWVNEKNVPSREMIDEMEKMVSLGRPVSAPVPQTQDLDEFKVTLPIILTISKKRMLEVVKLEFGSLALK